MRKPLIAPLLLLTAILAGPRISVAWDGDTHSMIARRSLENDLAGAEPVHVESIEDFLATTEYKTIPGFILALHLNPTTKFGFQIPDDIEKNSPEAIRLGDIFETYVNEPDWGMDKDICSSYSGFCKTKDKKNYKYIGALQPGISSQAFRHMYWPMGFIKLFSRILPVPVHVKEPLGEAPDRTQLFFDLSVRAAKTGHPYWAARFLAWSMHYAQDVAQPFHAAQLPSKKLEYKEVFIIPSVSVTVRKLAYYHLAFEGYISLLLRGQAGLGDEISKSLQSSIDNPPILPTDAPGEVTREAAEHSNSESFAGKAADAAIRYFPSFPKSAPNIEKYLRGSAFKEEVIRRSKPGPVLDEFTTVARSCLREAASASRTLLVLFLRESHSQTALQLTPKIQPQSIALPNASTIPFN